MNSARLNRRGGCLENMCDAAAVQRADFRETAVDSLLRCKRIMLAPPAMTAWYVVPVTAAAQLVVSMSNLLVPTIAPKVAESLAVDPVLVGYQVGLTFGAPTLASMYAGIAVLRWGAARITQVSMLFCLAGLGLLALPHVG